VRERPDLGYCTGRHRPYQRGCLGCRRKMMLLPRSRQLIAACRFSCNNFQLRSRARQTCTVGATSGAYGSVSVLSGAADDTTTTFIVSCSGTKNTRCGCVHRDERGDPHGCR
jgi:hypothetical protein